MNVVSTSGDMLHHHHHALALVSVNGTDDDGELDSAISPDEEGRTRRYMFTCFLLLFVVIFISLLLFSFALQYYTPSSLRIPLTFSSPTLTGT
jgi:hypothetical protein